ncbi:MAG TPA: hypothetical protein VIL16_33895 [Trebonia sp.]
MAVRRIDGRGRRWRFAVGCAGAALLLPPWGRAAAAERFVLGQHAPREHGLEGFDRLIAVRVRRPQISAGRRSRRQLVSRP